MAGWIYALGIAWDAVTDPFMGYIAERTRTKWEVIDLIFIMVLSH